MVYDRWGNLVYDNNSVPLNNPGMGWNGRFGASDLTSGVYAWIARVTYINDQSIYYTGDVTLLK